MAFLMVTVLMDTAEALNFHIRQMWNMTDLVSKSPYYASQNSLVIAGSYFPATRHSRTG